jgi:phage-related protein
MHRDALTYQSWYTSSTVDPILDVRFYATELGAEPVREWLKLLPAIDRKTVGEDIKTVQFGWPLGMPLVRNMGGGIWEVRIRLDNRIARVLFVLEGSTMVLLHGFIKKSQDTPKPDLDLAKDRLKQLRRR